MSAFIRNPLTGDKTVCKTTTMDGVLIRDGFGPDAQILLEWKPTYKRMFHVIGDSDVVLDIGANIGMFAVKSAQAGVRRVIAVEPEPGALSVLRMNARRFGRKIKIIDAAVGKHKGVTSLSISKTGSSTSASTYFSLRGRGSLVVPQLALKDLIEEFKPTVLKTDCEGEELNFLNGRSLPKCVEVVTGELHRERGCEAICKKVIQSFNGWTPIHEPKSYSFHRCWTIAYKRKWR